ncbi:peroxiredoxin family protein [Chitinophaga agrisoli]|uniref:Peroxiredoxin family protein n=1 Tax=Chitinophaga agrisoli TaxID=2607653 RepID=A0A5B2VZH5_9BACT|nr:redoxin domain-containing protein [Chitinophaga agrisoli]KAA2243732.1 peroxiredoxin family protein [Chitinophaga agrisoli]
MSSLIHRYADLEPLSLPERFNAPTRTRNRIAPLGAGDFVPEFNLPRTQFIAASSLPQDAGEQIAGRTLLGRPLVLAFISLHWNGYAQRLLQELQDLHADIQVMGGDLLVVSDEDSAGFASLAGQQSLPFNIVWDKQHKIASQFGVYATTDPIWDRISGVEADVPTPAVYVLGPSGKIVFDQVDLYLEKCIPTRDLLSTVYQNKQGKAA